MHGTETEARSSCPSSSSRSSINLNYLEGERACGEAQLPRLAFGIHNLYSLTLHIARLHTLGYLHGLCPYQPYISPVVSTVSFCSAPCGLEECCGQVENVEHYLCVPEGSVTWSLN